MAQRVIKLAMMMVLFHYRTKLPWFAQDPKIHQMDLFPLIIKPRRQGRFCHVKNRRRVAVVFLSEHFIPVVITERTVAHLRWELRLCKPIALFKRHRSL